CSSAAAPYPSHPTLARFLLDGEDPPPRRHWPGRCDPGPSLSAWTHELGGADVVVNLAGRSLNCRHTAENRREIKDSLVNSTRVALRPADTISRVGGAVANLSALWAERFRVPLVSGVQVAFDAPVRGLVISNVSGTFQLHAWDVGSSRLRSLT